ncbi:MAG TPA: adenosylhomocysteinase [Kofleriaceae bacterium]|nr:adenosylhomocysteinase [Kofleriaceae bacterium]
MQVPWAQDRGLASEGRVEIDRAATDMPGLRQLRERHRAGRPFAGARIAGSVHVTAQTAVLIETLVELGAEVSWTSSNPLSTQDRVAAAVAASGVAMFAWRGESPAQYHECLVHQLGAFGRGRGPNLLLDDGADLTELVHRDYPALLEGDDAIRGGTEQTTSGARRLRLRAAGPGLRFPVFDVNASITKSRFDNIYGSRESFLDGLKRATTTMIGGKVAVVCGYGYVGKGCAQGLRGLGARVVVTEIDPICALQAAMDGFEVATLEAIAAVGDLFITATGCPGVIRAEHMLQMKDGALMCNMGAYDHEVDFAWLCTTPGIARAAVSPMVDRFTLPSGRSVLVPGQGRIINLVCGPGHPSFVMSATFSNHVLALKTLWEARRGTYAPCVHRLPREVDEQVARLHLHALGAALTMLTAEQAEALGVSPAGPFKADDYAY